jgi:glucose dehydrogenase
LHFAVEWAPLKAITRDNVRHLRSAWSWSLPNGPNEATPLVHDGVLFVHSYGDKVQALDAATGDLLWQYSRQLPRDQQPSVKRAIAIYGDRLYDRRRMCISWRSTSKTAKLSGIKRLAIAKTASA